MSDEVHEQQARVWARQRREAGMAGDAIREELSRRGFSDPWIDAVMAEPLPERVEAGPERTAGRGCGGGVALWIILAVGCLGVIATVAVIAMAITAPVFFRAREKASSSSCLSNLKQLEVAQLMYAQDWNEVFPDATTWPEAQLPYTRNQNIYVCPEDPSPAMPGPFPVSYGMNVDLSRRELKTIARRAETPSLYDAATIYGDDTIAVFRHDDGLNVGFTDGHAKWIARGSWPAVWSAGVSSLAPPPSAPTNAPSTPPATHGTGAEQPQVPPAGGAGGQHTALENARRSACLDNLKVLATAQLMYVQDYDGRMPRAVAWPHLLYPYTRTHDLFLCPSDGTGSMQSPWAISYGMNRALDARLQSSLTSTRDVPSLMDATSLFGDPALIIEFRHEGEGGVTFADGHAKMLSETDWRALAGTGEGGGGP